MRCSAMRDDLIDSVFCQEEVACARRVWVLRAAVLFALHCMLRSFCREEAQTRRAARAAMCGMASQACVFTKSNYFDECHAPAAIAQKLRALPTPAGGTDLCAPPHCPLSAKASLMQRPALADNAQRWQIKPGVGR